VLAVAEQTLQHVAIWCSYIALRSARNNLSSSYQQEVKYYSCLMIGHIATTCCLNPSLLTYTYTFDASLLCWELHKHFRRLCSFYTLTQTGNVCQVCEYTTQVAYCEEQVECRRVLLLSHFGESGFTAALCHRTCDICIRNDGQVFAERDMTQAARDLIRVRTITLSLLTYNSR